MTSMEPIVWGWRGGCISGWWVAVPGLLVESSRLFGALLVLSLSGGEGRYPFRRFTAGLFSQAGTGKPVGSGWRPAIGLH